MSQGNGERRYCHVPAKAGGIHQRIQKHGMLVISDSVQLYHLPLKRLHVLVNWQASWKTYLISMVERSPYSKISSQYIMTQLADCSKVKQDYGALIQPISECMETEIVIYVQSEYKLVPEKAMAPHSSTLAWKIPWTEEPGRLQSMGS